eukprot:Clim_evm5s64 gene=Clim_evmTU5s64
MGIVRRRQYVCMHPDCKRPKPNKRNNVETHIWTQHVRKELGMPDSAYVAASYKHTVMPFVMALDDVIQLEKEAMPFLQLCNIEPRMHVFMRHNKVKGTHVSNHRINMLSREDSSIEETSSEVSDGHRAMSENDESDTYASAASPVRRSYTDPFSQSSASTISNMSSATQRPSLASSTYSFQSIAEAAEELGSPYSDHHAGAPPPPAQLYNSPPPHQGPQGQQQYAQPYAPMRYAPY